MLGDAALENIGKNAWPSKRKCHVKVLQQSRVDETMLRTRKGKITIVTTCGNNVRRKKCEECV